MLGILRPLWSRTSIADMTSVKKALFKGCFLTDAVTSLPSFRRVLLTQTLQTFIFQQSDNLRDLTGSHLDAGIVTVTDKIELDTEREIDLVLMTHVKPELTDAGISLAEGCTLEFDSRLTPEIEIVDPVGMDALAKWGSEVLYRMHFRIKAKEGEFTFTVKA